ncbi:hypothetical protein BLNAU_3567 [Blattamonas nauphoetae]|uniref:Uncharacterized protein n=1 Tax=Blattamonas nauphoetae TaxID=2049346 RepID=A0ABQ9YCQ3_9EUKA|nr:hypothetical protein BLNAU_3567 [Blattamonas nauphoetae]
MNIEITNLTTVPNDCLLSAPLDLTVGLKLEKPIKAGKWVIRFIFDFSFQKHSVVLLETQPKDYSAGESTETFHIDSIDLSGLKEKELLNMGLLSASLFIENETKNSALDINMCTEITKEKDGYRRTILNPLE